MPAEVPQAESEPSLSTALRFTPVAAAHTDNSASQAGRGSHLKKKAFPRDSRRQFYPPTHLHAVRPQVRYVLVLPRSRTLETAPTTLTDPLTRPRIHAQNSFERSSRQES